MQNNVENDVTINDLRKKIEDMEAEKQELVNTIKKLTDENNVLVIKNNKLITLYSALFNQVLNME